MNNSKKLKPGRWLYLIGSLVIVAGIIISIALGVGAGLQMLENGKTVKVPGDSTLSFDKAGSYVMTFKSAGDGKTTTDFSAYSALKFTLTGNGKTDSLTSKFNTVQFKIDKAGSYKLSAAYPNGNGPSAEMVIISGDGVNTVLIGVVFWVCLIGGVLIIIVTAVLRKKNKKLMYNN